MELMAADTGYRRVIGVPSVTDARITSLPKTKRQDLIQYKALAFHAGRRNASVLASMAFVIETKGIKPDWDPDLGPNGGWRCPSGTRFGGYITDRYGRGCGGSVVRRLGKLYGEIGKPVQPTAVQKPASNATTRELRRLTRAQQRGARQAVAKRQREAFDGIPVRAARRFGSTYRRRSFDAQMPSMAFFPRRKKKGTQPKKAPIVSRMLDNAGFRFESLIDRVLYGKNVKKKKPVKRVVTTAKAPKKRQKKSPTAKKPNIVTRVLDQAGVGFENFIDRILYGKQPAKRRKRKTGIGSSKPVKTTVVKQPKPTAAKKKKAKKTVAPIPKPKKKVGKVGFIDVAALTDAQKVTLGNAALANLNELDAFWQQQLGLMGGDIVDEQTIDDYIQDLIEQYNNGDKSLGATIGYLKAQANDTKALRAWQAKNDAGDPDALNELNNLGPTRRKTLLDAIGATPPAKKVPAKKPAPKKVQPPKPPKPKPSVPTPEPEPEAIPEPEPEPIPEPEPEEEITADNLPPHLMPEPDVIPDEVPDASTEEPETIPEPAEIPELPPLPETIPDLTPSPSEKPDEEIAPTDVVDESAASAIIAVDPPDSPAKPLPPASQDNPAASITENYPSVLDNGVIATYGKTPEGLQAALDFAHSVADAYSPSYDGLIVVGATPDGKISVLVAELHDGTYFAPDQYVATFKGNLKLGSTKSKMLSHKWKKDALKATPGGVHSGPVYETMKLTAKGLDQEKTLQAFNKLSDMALNSGLPAIAVATLGDDGKAMLHMGTPETVRNTITEMVKTDPALRLYHLATVHTDGQLIVNGDESNGAVRYVVTSADGTVSQEYYRRADDKLDAWHIAALDANSKEAHLAAYIKAVTSPIEHQDLGQELSMTSSTDHGLGSKWNTFVAESAALVEQKITNWTLSPYMKPAVKIMKRPNKGAVSKRRVSMQLKHMYLGNETGQSLGPIGNPLPLNTAGDAQDIDNAAVDSFIQTLSALSDSEYRYIVNMAPPGETPQFYQIDHSTYEYFLSNGIINNNQVAYRAHKKVPYYHSPTQTAVVSYNSKYGTTIPSTNLDFVDTTDLPLVPVPSGQKYFQGPWGHVIKYFKDRTHPDLELPPPPVMPVITVKPIDTAKKVKIAAGSVLLTSGEPDALPGEFDGPTMDEAIAMEALPYVDKAMRKQAEWYGQQEAVIAVYGADGEKQLSETQVEALITTAVSDLATARKGVPYPDPVNHENQVPYLLSIARAQKKLETLELLLADIKHKNAVLAASDDELSLMQKDQAAMQLASKPIAQIETINEVMQDVEYLTKEYIAAAIDKLTKSDPVVVSPAVFTTVKNVVNNSDSNVITAADVAIEYGDARDSHMQETVQRINSRLGLIKEAFDNYSIAVPDPPTISAKNAEEGIPASKEWLINALTALNGKGAAALKVKTVIEPTMGGLVSRLQDLESLLRNEDDELATIKANIFANDITVVDNADTPAAVATPMAVKPSLTIFAGEAPISMKDAGDVNIPDTIGLMQEHAIEIGEPVMLVVTNDDKLKVAPFASINKANVQSVIAGVTPDGNIYIGTKPSNSLELDKWFSKFGKWGTGGFKTPIGATHAFEADGDPYASLDKVAEIADDLIMSVSGKGGSWSLGPKQSAPGPLEPIIESAGSSAKQKIADMVQQLAAYPNHGVSVAPEDVEFYLTPKTLNKLSTELTSKDSPLFGSRLFAVADPQAQQLRLIRLSNFDDGFPETGYQLFTGTRVLAALTTLPSVIDGDVLFPYVMIPSVPGSTESNTPNHLNPYMNHLSSPQEALDALEAALFYDIQAGTQSVAQHFNIKAQLLKLGELLPSESAVKPEITGSAYVKPSIGLANQLSGGPIDLEHGLGTLASMAIASVPEGYQPLLASGAWVQPHTDMPWTDPDRLTGAIVHIPTFDSVAILNPSQIAEMQTNPVFVNLPQHMQPSILAYSYLNGPEEAMVPVLGIPTKHISVQDFKQAELISTVAPWDAYAIQAVDENDAALASAVMTVMPDSTPIKYRGAKHKPIPKKAKTLDNFLKEYDAEAYAGALIRDITDPYGLATTMQQIMREDGINHPGKMLVLAEYEDPDDMDPTTKHSFHLMWVDSEGDSFGDPDEMATRFAVYGVGRRKITPEEMMTDSEPTSQVWQVALYGEPQPHDLVNIYDLAADIDQIQSSNAVIVTTDFGLPTAISSMVGSELTVIDADADPETTVQTQILPGNPTADEHLNAMARALRFVAQSLGVSDDDVAIPQFTTAQPSIPRTKLYNQYKGLLADHPDVLTVDADKFLTDLIGPSTKEGYADFISEVIGDFFPAPVGYKSSHYGFSGANPDIPSFQGNAPSHQTYLRALSGIIPYFAYLIKQAELNGESGPLDMYNYFQTDVLTPAYPRFDDLMEFLADTAFTEPDWVPGTIPNPQMFDFYLTAKGIAQDSEDMQRFVRNVARGILAFSQGEYGARRVIGQFANGSQDSEILYNNYPYIEMPDLLSVDGQNLVPELIKADRDFSNQVLNAIAKLPAQSSLRHPIMTQLYMAEARSRATAHLASLLHQIAKAENDGDIERARNYRSAARSYLLASPVLAQLPGYEKMRASVLTRLAADGYAPLPIPSKKLSAKKGSITPKYSAFDGTIAGTVADDGMALAPHVLPHAAISSLQESVDHLKSGGQIALVPDDFLRDAIKANTGPGKRFSDIGITSGYNTGTFGVADSMSLNPDGSKREYIIKDPHQNPAEHIQEIMGSMLEHELGIPAVGHRLALPMQMRPPKSSLVSTIPLAPQRAIMQESIKNLFALEGWTVLGHNVNLPEGATWHPESLAKFVALNRFINHYDRTTANAIVVLDPQKRAHVIPIDDGNAFYDWKEYGKGPHQPDDENTVGFDHIGMGGSHAWWEYAKEMSPEDKALFVATLARQSSKWLSLDLDELESRLKSEPGWNPEEISHIAKQFAILKKRRSAIDWQEKVVRMVDELDITQDDLNAAIAKLEAAESPSSEPTTGTATTAYNSLAQLTTRNVGATFFWDDDRIKYNEVEVANAMLANNPHSSDPTIETQAVVLQFRLDGDAMSIIQGLDDGTNGWTLVPGREQPILPRYDDPVPGDTVNGAVVSADSEGRDGSGMIRYIDFNQRPINSIGGEGKLFYKVFPDGTVAYAFQAKYTSPPSGVAPEDHKWGFHSYGGHILLIKPTDSTDPQVLEVSGMDQLLEQVLGDFEVESKPPTLGALQLSSLRNMAVQLFGNKARKWSMEQVIEKMASKGITTDDFELGLDGYFQPYMRLRKELRDQLSSTIPRLGIVHGWYAFDGLLASIENGGLTSAIRRIQSGFPRGGSSTSSDTTSGGNDWTFHGFAGKAYDDVSILTTESTETILDFLTNSINSQAGKKPRSITPLEFVLERPDSVWTDTDHYGSLAKHVSVASAASTSPMMAQPMIRGQIPLSRQVHVFATKADRDAAVERAKQLGLSVIDGIPVEMLFLWEGDPKVVDNFKALREMWKTLGWIS